MEGRTYSSGSLLAPFCMKLPSLPGDAFFLIALVAESTTLARRTRVTRNMVDGVWNRRLRICSVQRSIWCRQSSVDELREVRARRHARLKSRAWQPCHGAFDFTVLHRQLQLRKDAGVSHFRAHLS